MVVNGYNIVPFANLRGADLSDADLRGTYLSGANLTGANLRGANLRSANLRDADLRNADLRSADLRDADLRSANFMGADLRVSKLLDTNLVGADFTNANLTSADLSGATIRFIVDGKLHGQPIKLSSNVEIFAFNKKNSRLCHMLISDQLRIVICGCYINTLDAFEERYNNKYPYDPVKAYKAQIAYLRSI